jgi:hypothetical protein
MRVSRKLFPFSPVIPILALCISVQPATADSSHARIIRLSLVQGDVRFARVTHGDPLTDSKAVWEAAELNLPVRQGFVLATDNGRAEVEFENGAMAFLKENTVLEFYDLSLEDGARTTRLVLRQGSASFYVNPASGDYFSVTGGDFTVEANQRARFRLDNYDDGSRVEALGGHISVLQNEKTTPLSKGQSLSVKAGKASSLSVGALPDEDDFDQWVSGRIDTVSTATASAAQYTSSASYAPGFADLYSYGSWFSCGGSGYGWRPFGVGASWSPFAGGQWILDPTYGWTYMSAQPWGWAPYHYGGWLFDAGCGGWFYSPPAFYGIPTRPGRRIPPRIHPPHPVIYHAATAVFVRKNGTVGIVPMHPLDEKGKTPLNMEHGVYSLAGPAGVGEAIAGPGHGQKWEPLKSAPRDALSSSLVATTSPARVSKTVIEGQSGVRVVSLNHDSSITYDPREHRFVNAETAVSAARTNEKDVRSGTENEKAVSGASRPDTATPARNPAIPSAARIGGQPPAARSTVPPPAPRYSGGERGSSAGRSSEGRSSFASSSSSAGHSSSAPSTSSSHSSGHAH